MGNTNSYGYIKAIAEELRGLAIEKNVPIITATQFTRGGFADSDPELDDIAESFGLAATADFILGIINTDELEHSNKFLCKQLKSRYGNKALHSKFVIGVNKDFQRLYDVDDNRESVKHDIQDSSAVIESRRNQATRFSDFNFN